MAFQKKLFFGFLIGLVLIGVGCGVTFAEISTFEYGGKKNITENGTETKTMALKIDDTKENYYFTMSRYYTGENMKVEVDDSLSDEEIVIEAEVNGSGVVPEISIDNGFYENMEYYESYNGYNGEVIYQDNGGQYYDIRQMTEKDMICNIYFNYYRYNNGALNFVKHKDEFLASLKERKLYDYVYNDVEKVTIKVSPANKNRVFIIFD
ncbi:MAG: hypothetical protein HFE62_01425 [Firmicutes bacterium]|nr:hypothetical protein [Bacillota bacterium]